MRLLCGELAPHSGEILIGGQDIFLHPKRTKQYFGYLPAVPPLYDDMMVGEYLKFCANIHDLFGIELQRSIAWVSEWCELKDLHQELIGHLSAGMRQRVAIAQSIIHRPKIIILDEPTSTLDPLQIQHIHELISELADQHCVILASHNLTEVEKLSKNILLMKQGRLIHHSSIEELLEFTLSRIIEIRCKKMQQIELLQNLSFVAQVERKDSEHFWIYCEPSFMKNNQSLKQISLEIVRLAHRLDWQLYEIYIRQHSLENIYLHLSREKESNHAA